MKLNLLEAALEAAKKKNESESFSKLLLACREAIGMKQYKAAEFLGIHQPRLARLEQSFFRDMPTARELQRIHELFGLEVEIMEEKAFDHVKKVAEERKIKFYPIQEDEE